MSQRIYVETRVRASMAALWDATQGPDAHASWDLRFSAIIQLATPVGEPQRFRYENRSVPGAPLTGVGISAGERHRPDGSCTSALRFRADSRLSPIASGHGFWRYVPDGDAIRFVTGYDYVPGWQGAAGDRLARPVIGWMTAWSFDRLRLWLEHGISPRASLRRTVVSHVVRLGAVVAALVLLERPVAVVVAALALVTPAPVRLPRARRCLRRPPRGSSDTPPRISETVDEAALGAAHQTSTPDGPPVARRPVREERLP
ncbi:hypothetical protein [Sanguibacter sp. 25GB23B1]|uniref:hypothetical protein n=1 Tax=unclassified Sanguibacter TaxID=2645534 RepID=UPI0032AEEA9D